MRKKDTEGSDLHALLGQSVVTLAWQLLRTISPQVSVAPATTTTTTATVTGSICRETQRTRSRKLHNRYVSTYLTKPLLISCLSNWAKTTTNLDSESGQVSFKLLPLPQPLLSENFKMQHLQKHTSYIFCLFVFAFSRAHNKDSPSRVNHLIPVIQYAFSPDCHLYDLTSHCLFFFFPLSSQRP